jgi:nucleoside-diphosphate-sugar epimerase
MTDEVRYRLLRCVEQHPYALQRELLVTGAAGFIGHRVSRSLLDQRNEVLAAPAGRPHDLLDFRLFTHSKGFACVIAAPDP